MVRPHPLLDIHAEVLNIVRYLREVLPKDIIIPTPPSSSTQSQPLAQSLENIADKIYRQYLQESAAVHDDHDNATLPTYTHGKRTSVSFKRKTKTFLYIFHSRLCILKYTCDITSTAPKNFL